MDCADPACQPDYTCVAAPTGWAPGAFLASIPDQGAPSSCPAGYAPSPLRVQMPAFTVTCSCTCGSSCGEVVCGISTADYPPGPLTLGTAGPDGGCSDVDAGSLTSPGCVPYQLKAGQSIGFAKPPVYISSTLSMGDTGVGHLNALLCTAPVTGGGCGAGRACVPKPTTEWSICLYQAASVDGRSLSAAVACPQAWVSSLGSAGGAPIAVGVATSWDDSNACTPCDCETDPEAGCADAALTLYSDSSCQTVVTTVGPGVCGSVDADIQSAQYTATPTHAGCTNSPSAPTGVEKSSPDAGYVVCSAG